MRALLWRDLALSLRAGGGFGLGLAFFLIVAVLVPFGVGPENALLSKIAAGVLWLGALLACLLSLDRIFKEMPDVPLRDHVWPKFLRENAIRVFKLDE